MILSFSNGSIFEYQLKDTDNFWDYRLILS